MPKIVTSPVAKFPGTVTLADPMSLPQVVALEAAIHDAEGQAGAAGDLALLPGLLGCVESVEIINVPAHPTPETWPATPRKPAYELLRWLTREIMAVYAGETEIPNA